MRRNLAKLLASTLLCAACAAESAADVVVIVNRDNPVQAMSPKEVSDLYLGRTHSFRAASLAASIYEQPNDSALREAFFRALNGMSLSQVNAYWARLRFSGEVLPPRVLPDNRTVVDAIRRDVGAIGYVDAATDIGDSAKVVLRLRE